METKNKKTSSIVNYFKTLSKKDKIILASTIILVSVVLGLRFIILPQLEQYTNNIMALDMKRSEQARVEMIPAQNKILEENNNMN